MANIKLAQQMKKYAVIVALMAEYTHIEIARSFLVKIRHELDCYSTAVVKY